QERRPVDALGLQQRGRLRLLGRAQLLPADRHKTFALPLADRFCHFGYPKRAIDIGRGAHLVSPAYVRLPTLVDELLRGGSERIRHRMPEVFAPIALQLDRMLV